MVTSMSKYIEEGTIYCPNCNRSERILLLDIYEVVDNKVYGDSETPNVYPVSILRCDYCSTIFEVERLDLRELGITEISFGEFTAYTTLPIEIAIRKAKRWYHQHFDGKLEKPSVTPIGKIIFTLDPRVIVYERERD
jgi:hypothetical protein